MSTAVISGGRESDPAPGQALVLYNNARDFGIIVLEFL